MKRLFQIKVPTFGRNKHVHYIDETEFFKDLFSKLYGLNDIKKRKNSTHQEKDPTDDQKRKITVFRFRSPNRDVIEISRRKTTSLGADVESNLEKFPNPINNHEEIKEKRNGFTK